MDDWDSAPPLYQQTLRYFMYGMRIFWGLLGDQKKVMAYAAGILAFTKALDLTFPLFLKMIFDRLPSIVSGHTISGVVVLLIAGMFIVKIASIAITRFIQEPMFVKSLIRLENRWPVIAQEKLLALSLGYHERENTGKKIAKINKGCDRLVEMAMNLYWSLLPALFYLLINVVFILVMDWRLGLLFLFPLIPAVAINLCSYRRFMPMWEQWDKMKESASGTFCQSLLNVQTVQSYVQEGREKNRFAAMRSEMEKIDIKASIGIQKYFFAMGLVLNLSFTATILIGLYFVYTGVSTIGTVVFILATGNVTLQSLWEVVHTYTRIMRNLISAERLKRLLDEPVELVNAPNATIPTSYEGYLSFQRVAFRYGEKRRPIFRDFSLELKPGSMVAMVGRSGSGKSTIVNLLTRVYDVSGGSIMLDGRDIRSIDRDWYRKIFAVVKQDIDLFDASLIENITYAYPDAPEKEIEEALRASHLWDVVQNTNRFPAGVQTQVGERGVRLSGGERQRVGIARAYLALLSGARVLVLDEATSHLDSEAERAIQEMLEHLRKRVDISIIAIAHRLSTIQRADVICVLDNGTLIESSTHEDLLANKGLYAKLVALQQFKDVPALSPSLLVDHS